MCNDVPHTRKTLSCPSLIWYRQAFKMTLDNLVFANVVWHVHGSSMHTAHYLGVHVGLPGQQELRVVSINHFSTTLPSEYAESGSVPLICIGHYSGFLIDFLSVVKLMPSRASLLTHVSVVMLLVRQYQSTEFILTQSWSREFCDEVLNDVRSYSHTLSSLKVFVPPQAMHLRWSLQVELNLPK